MVVVYFKTKVIPMAHHCLPNISGLYMAVSDLATLFSAFNHMIIREFCMFSHMTFDIIDV